MERNYIEKYTDENFCPPMNFSPHCKTVSKAADCIYRHLKTGDNRCDEDPIGLYTYCKNNIDQWDDISSNEAVVNFCNNFIQAENIRNEHQYAFNKNFLDNVGDATVTYGRDPLNAADPLYTCILNNKGSASKNTYNYNKATNTFSVYRPDLVYTDAGAAEDFCRYHNGSPTIVGQTCMSKLGYNEWRDWAGLNCSENGCYFNVDQINESTKKNVYNGYSMCNKDKAPNNMVGKIHCQGKSWVNNGNWQKITGGLSKSYLAKSSKDDANKFCYNEYYNKLMPYQKEKRRKKLHSECINQWEKRRGEDIDGIDDFIYIPGGDGGDVGEHGEWVGIVKDTDSALRFCNEIFHPDQGKCIGTASPPVYNKKANRNACDRGKARCRETVLKNFNTGDPVVGWQNLGCNVSSGCYWDNVNNNWIPVDNPGDYFIPEKVEDANMGPALTNAEINVVTDGIQYCYKTFDGNAQSSDRNTCVNAARRDLPCKNEFLNVETQNSTEESRVWEEILNIPPN